MGSLRRISYLWQDEQVTEDALTGVSLHSHTNRSKETLDFIALLGERIRWLDPVVKRVERRAERRHRVAVDYARSYWTPPLTPKLAFDLESEQIVKLGLKPLVSLTDHDDMEAPMLLRTVASARHIPVSVEWSVPFGGNQSFHIGVHNLPSESGQAWMDRFAAFTAGPADERELTAMLAELNALPNVLLVFNHPMWDMYLIGRERYRALVRRFLERNGGYLHALELNGLRDWGENREVRRLAKETGRLLIAGGDRHGMEPNANINLTDAATFTEFVHEIRREGRSHVLFLPQYAEPFKHRVLRSTLDVIRDYPDFPQGSRRWDERVWHPGPDGTMVPIAELWPREAAPVYIRALLAGVRGLGTRPVSRGLRKAWSDRAALRYALGE